MILIIGKGYIGRSLQIAFANRHTKTFLMSHDDNWAEVIRLDRPALVVNAAAIVGQKRCKEAGFEAVKKANINFAQSVLYVANEYGAKCVLLSTGSVYDNPHSTPKSEEDAVSARNLYIESKIGMEEQTIAKNPYIFRIPSVMGNIFHDGDYVNRIQRWQWVQDCYASLLSTAVLATSLEKLLVLDVDPGIYNLSLPRFIHLPTYVSRVHKPLPIQDKLHPNFTQSHLLYTGKAERAHLL